MKASSFVLKADIYRLLLATGFGSRRNVQEHHDDRDQVRLGSLRSDAPRSLGYATTTLALVMLVAAPSSSIRGRQMLAGRGNDDIDS